MQSEMNIWTKVCMPLTQRTAQILNTKQKELHEIQWTNGEANTDSEFSRLACISCEEAWNHIKRMETVYNDVSLTANPPDINISFYKDSNILASGKIELKSGKTPSIPGSTILKLNINQPVIFCLRNESNLPFEFRYSQYHNSVGETNSDMFQDRSPRYPVNFTKMTDINVPIEYVHKEKGDWAEHYAKCALFRIAEKKSHSWQDDLVEKIIKLFIKKTSIEEFSRLKQGLSQ